MRQPPAKCLKGLSAGTEHVHAALLMNQMTAHIGCFSGASFLPRSQGLLNARLLWQSSPPSTGTSETDANDNNKESK